MRRKIRCCSSKLSLMLLSHIHLASNVGSPLVIEVMFFRHLNLWIFAFWTWLPIKHLLFILILI